MGTEEVQRALRQIAAGFVALADAIEEPEVIDPEAAEPEEETPKPEAEPRGEMLRRRFRDWAVAKGDDSFGSEQVCAELGVHVNTARKLLRWATDRGIIEQFGEQHLERGRPRKLYRYLRAEAAKPKKAAKAAAAERAQAVAGTGKRAGKTAGLHRDVRALIGELRAAGWMTDHRGIHVKVLDPKGRIVTTLPSTPSDHRSLPNARAKLRRAGAPI